MTIIGPGTQADLTLRRQLISAPLSILGLLALSHRGGLDLLGFLRLDRHRFLPNIGRGILVGIAVTPPLLLVNYLARLVFPPSELHPAFQALFDSSFGWKSLGVIVVVVVLAPALEEILFRGVFLLGISSIAGRGWGLLVSSLLFGAAHYRVWPDPIPLTLLALVLGIAFLHSGTLWIPIVIHATFNAIMLGLFFLS